MPGRRLSPSDSPPLPTQTPLTIGESSPSPRTNIFGLGASTGAHLHTAPRHVKSAHLAITDEITLGRTHRCMRGRFQTQTQPALSLPVSVPLFGLDLTNSS